MSKAIAKMIKMPVNSVASIGEPVILGFREKIQSLRVVITPYNTKKRLNYQPFFSIILSDTLGSVDI
jgi:hypothetical protein